MYLHVIYIYIIRYVYMARRSNSERSRSRNSSIVVVVVVVWWYRVAVRWLGRGTTTIHYTTTHAHFARVYGSLGGASSSGMRSVLPASPTLPRSTLYSLWYIIRILRAQFVVKIIIIIMRREYWQTVYNKTEMDPERERERWENNNRSLIRYYTERLYNTTTGFPAVADQQSIINGEYKSGRRRRWVTRARGYVCRRKITIFITV